MTQQMNNAAKTNRNNKFIVTFSNGTRQVERIVGGKNEASAKAHASRNFPLMALQAGGIGYGKIVAIRPA